MDAVKEVLAWVVANTAPNDKRRYSRCPICHQAWWDDKVMHLAECWVPRLTAQGGEPPAPNRASTPSVCDGCGGVLRGPVTVTLCDDCYSLVAD